MRIRVTQQHIDEGKRGSSTRDPIAFAMADAGLERPYAGVNYLSWHEDDRKMFMKTPKEVYDFMLNFDNGKQVEPFEFQIMDETL